MEKRNNTTNLMRHLLKLCLKANCREAEFKESEISKWSSQQILEKLGNEMRLLPEDVKRRLVL